MTDLDEQTDEVRHGKGRGGSGGARVEMRDRRVSTALAWLMGVLGTATVLTMGWVATSINELNLNVARLIVRTDAKDLRDDRQDADIRELTRDVSVLNGKQLRGGPPEVKRGR